MRYYTAGESHGQGLVAIIEGVPAGLKVSEEQINIDLARRQSGYGRGGRQKIERDTVQVISGIRFGRTMGSPVAMIVKNRDWENWTDRMAPFGEAPLDLVREVTPRPGHADLVGALKTNTDDCRNILERSSARTTAPRVAAAGIAREFLADLGVDIFSYVVSIGSVSMREENPYMNAAQYTPLALETRRDALSRCPRQPRPEARNRPRHQNEGQPGRHVPRGGARPASRRGRLRRAYRAPHVHHRRRAVQHSRHQGRGIRHGLRMRRRPGSQVHDSIELDRVNANFTRTSNNAGGLEGGMTTGMPLVVTAAMKPIPTLMQPLQTVNLDTLEVAQASKERSDVCAVPAAAVVAEGEVAFALADAYMRKFGSDNMADIKAAIKAYKQRLNTMSR